MLVMKKTDLIQYLRAQVTTQDKKITRPTLADIAARLGYTHRNNLIRLPEELTSRQANTMRMRMRAAGIVVPKNL